MLASLISTCALPSTVCNQDLGCNCYQLHAVYIGDDICALFASKSSHLTNSTSQGLLIYEYQHL